MIFYVIAFLCLIGGLNATGNDQCVVPVFCPKDGRRGWLAVPNIEKLPSSVFCPNTCPLREACKEKMDETRKVLDHELNTLSKEFMEVNELLKKKVKARKTTTSTGEVTTAAITKETHRSEDVTTSSTIEPIATTDGVNIPETPIPSTTLETSTVPPIPCTTNSTNSSDCGPLYNRCSDGSVCRDIPTARADRCDWTRWYKRDHPSYYEDFELLSRLRKNYPGEICAVPTCVQARVLSTQQPYNTTGDIVHISPCIGFSCRNAEQPGCATPTTRCCQNYEVRFCCPTDFKWNGKYFWVKSFPTDKINYTQAVAECRNSKGSGNAHPANIYDAMHYKNITEYLRPQITTNRRFWLGMTYNNTDQKLYLNNGTKANYEKWMKNHPKTGSGPHIMLKVEHPLVDEASEGMVFVLNDTKKRYGVLCEEE